jgi:hypothetical protein
MIDSFDVGWVSLTVNYANRVIAEESSSILTQNEWNFKFIDIFYKFFKMINKYCADSLVIESHSMLTQLTYVLLRIDLIENQSHLASNQCVENIKYVNGG